jgi:hypothetical protein
MVHLTVISEHVIRSQLWCALQWYLNTWYGHSSGAPYSDIWAHDTVTVMVHLTLISEHMIHFTPTRSFFPLLNEATESLIGMVVNIHAFCISVLGIKLFVSCCWYLFSLSPHGCMCVWTGTKLVSSLVKEWIPNDPAADLPLKHHALP